MLPAKLRPDVDAGMPPRRNRRRRAFGRQQRAACVIDRDRSAVGIPSWDEAQERAAFQMRESVGDSDQVTPRPSSAARHIASGSSNTTRLLERATISSPVASRISRSRMRPVCDERMTIPSKAQAPLDRSAASGLSGRTATQRQYVQRRKRARHHARHQLDAAADRRIESFGDQIDQPALKLPVGTDIRVAFQKLRQQRQDVINSKSQAEADLDARRLVRCEFVARCNGRLRLPDIASNRLLKTPPASIRSASGAALI